MLPRLKRINVSLFATVLARGKIVHSPLFTARVLSSKDTTTVDGARFSAVVSKKIAKTAVLRNKLRRRIYSALKDFDNRVKNGSQVILLSKPTILKFSVKDISADLESLFVKSGILK